MDSTIPRCLRPNTDPISGSRENTEYRPRVTADRRRVRCEALLRQYDKGVLRARDSVLCHGGINGCVPRAEEVHGEA